MSFKQLKYWPVCACTEQDEVEIEQRVLVCVTGATMSLTENIKMQNLCGAVDDYAYMSLITALTCALCITGEDGAVVNEIAFERVLSTLVDDIRLRRASMENTDGSPEGVTLQ